MEKNNQNQQKKGKKKKKKKKDEITGIITIHSPDAIAANI